MIEIMIKVSPQFEEFLRRVAEQRFNGDLTAVMLASLEAHLFSKEAEREKLKQLVQEIRREVMARGGIDKKDLDRRIREHRKAANA